MIFHSQTQPVRLSDPFKFKARNSSTIIPNSNILSPSVRRSRAVVLVYGRDKPPTSLFIIAPAHACLASLAPLFSSVIKWGLKLRRKYGGPSKRWEACSACDDFTCRTMACDFIRYGVVPKVVTSPHH